MAADRAEPSDVPRLGSVFGRYDLDTLVGRGGMGVVFRATDLSLQRPVALKFLSPALPTDQAFKDRDHAPAVARGRDRAPGDRARVRRWRHRSLYIAMHFVPRARPGGV